MLLNIIHILLFVIGGFLATGAIHYIGHKHKDRERPGYVLMPEEPTGELIKASMQAMYVPDAPKEYVSSREKHIIRYKAMVAEAKKAKNA